MKPGDLFNAKVGAVCVTVEELPDARADMRWMVNHFERIRNHAVRGVAFYAATRNEAIEKLKQSKRSLPNEILQGKF